MTSTSPSKDALETANMRLVAELILQSAILRCESRGAHYRTDFPDRNDAEFQRHSWVKMNRPAIIEK